MRKLIPALAVAFVAAGAAVPAHATEGQPYAYGSQPHQVCGAVYANDVEGVTYTIDGKPFAAREERREVTVFTEGTQSEVVATEADGTTTSFWVSVNPCIDWEATARENAAREQAALARVSDLEDQVDSLRAKVARLKGKLKDRRAGWR